MTDQEPLERLAALSLFAHFIDDAEVAGISTHASPQSDTPARVQKFRVRPRRVGHYVQKSFMGWAYMSLAVSGARPKAPSIVAVRLYWL